MTNSSDRRGPSWGKRKEMAEGVSGPFIGGISHRGGLGFRCGEAMDGGDASGSLGPLARGGRGSR
jgi:hypothetical protein